MLASELVAVIQAAIVEHGDLEVFDYDEYSNHNHGWHRVHGIGFKDHEADDDCIRNEVCDQFLTIR